MIRELSFSEISTAMTCQAQWDFSYGGHLAGDALTSKVLHPSLSGGRAWGAAVAAWHSQEDPDDLEGRIIAHEALRTSFRADVVEQVEKGVWVDLLSQVQAEQRAASVLDHYMYSSDPLPFTVQQREREVDFALPSRTGIRSSNRFRFKGFIDAFAERYSGRSLVEYKLRKDLTPPDIIQIQPQTRWYALGDALETGVIPESVYVDERLNQPPVPPKIVQGKKKGTLRPSDDVRQWTTPEWYVAMCQEYNVEPKESTVEALSSRIWQQRIEIAFREDEIETAKLELVSAAQMISELDSGRRYPIRNAQTRLCRPCRFRRICPNAEDRMLVDLYFDRKPPKRLRSALEADSSSGPHSADAGKTDETGIKRPSSAESSQRVVAGTPYSLDARGGSHGSASNALRKGQIPGQTMIDDFLETSH